MIVGDNLSRSLIYKGGKECFRILGAKLPEMVIEVFVEHIVPFHSIEFAE